MRKLTYYVALSIDGFIAAPDGAADFYPLGDDLLEYMKQEFPEMLPTHARAQLGVDVPNKRFDTVIQGRGTYAAALELGITSPFAHLRQYVVSGTLPADTDPAVAIVSEDVTGTVRRLKAEQDGLGIYLAGGARLAGQLLPEIDELIVKTYPVVAGAGIPMFAAEHAPRLFALTGSRVFGSGAAVHTYARREAAPVSPRIR